ncbi:MAG: diacylglycerol kinase family protein [candidate division Zixibacteria bacterium]
MILNPISGGGRALKILPKIVDWANKNGSEFELLTTTIPGDGIRLGRLCRFQKFQRVVVLGGDGSVNEVGSTLAGSDIVMGVLPGGTGNDFYKMLRNNNGLKSGLETAFFGKPQNVDIGLVNGRPFFNAVGIGFDAEVAHRAIQSDGSSGMMVYLSAVFQSLRNHRPIELEIEFDRVKIESKVTLFCVGNGRSSGGGFYLTPHANFSDGLFDVCLIEAMPKSRIFRYLPRTLNGSHVRLPGVKIYRSKKITISSYSELPVHIDGEPFSEPVKRIEFKMDKRKLKVAVA